MLKSRGPRLNPCGTPAINFSYSLNESPVLQRWYLFVRQLLRDEAAFQLRPIALSFATSMLYYKMSNALEGSTPIFFLLFNCAFLFPITLCRANCVLWFFRKPVRNFKNFVSKNQFSWLYISFSKTFEKFNKMLTCL